jgi:hypothetical protein
MAYLRFSRDRRGYEQFALVQPSNRRGSKSRPRVLYWFRSPPNVKVGREPFDPEARRTLEARNPDVAFDWPAIISTPIPPVENESWRERRRAERAARQAVDSPEVLEPPAIVTGSDEPTVTVSPAAEAALVSEPAIEEALPIGTTPVPGRRRRRRRRRRGGQQREQVPGAVPTVEPAIHELGAVDLGPGDADVQGEEPAVGGPDEEV